MLLNQEEFWKVVGDDRALEPFEAQEFDHGSITTAKLVDGIQSGNVHRALGQVIGLVIESDGPIVETIGFLLAAGLGSVADNPHFSGNGPFFEIVDVIFEDLGPEFFSPKIP
jgi:hypothetical protein